MNPNIQFAIEKLQEANMGVLTSERNLSEATAAYEAATQAQDAARRLVRERERELLEVVRGDLV